MQLASAQVSGMPHTEPCMESLNRENGQELAPRARIELASLWLTALKPNSSQFAGAERNRRESASSDKPGKVRFAFSFQRLFSTSRASSPFAGHCHDTAPTSVWHVSGERAFRPLEFRNIKEPSAAVAFQAIIRISRPVPKRVFDAPIILKPHAA